MLNFLIGLLFLCQGPQIDHPYCGKTADNFPPPFPVCENPTAAQQACLDLCHQDYVTKMMAAYTIACQRYENAYEDYKDKQQDIFDAYDTCKSNATGPAEFDACRDVFVNSWYNNEQSWKAMGEYIFNFVKNSTNHAKNEYADCASACCPADYITIEMASGGSRPLPNCGQIPAIFTPPAFSCPEGSVMNPVCYQNAYNDFQSDMQAAYDAYCAAKEQGLDGYKKCVNACLDLYDTCMEGAVTQSQKNICRLDAFATLIVCTATLDLDQAVNELEFENDVSAAETAFLALVADCCITE